MLYATIALLVVAQEPTFSFDVKKQTLGDLVLLLKLPVKFDEELARKLVTLKVDNQPLATVIDGLAKAAGGKVVGKRIVTPWRYDLHAVLQKKRIIGRRGADRHRPVEPTGKSNIDLNKALDFLRAVTGADIVLDPQLLKTFKVDFNLANISCLQALDLLTAANELNWDLRYGVVFVSTKKRMKALPRLSPQLPKSKKRVSLFFAKTTVPQMASYLTAFTGAKFVVPEEAKSLEVSAAANNVTLAQALALCLYPIGCTAEAKEDSIVIKKR